MSIERLKAALPNKSTENHRIRGYVATWLQFKCGGCRPTEVIGVHRDQVSFLAAGPPACSPICFIVGANGDR